MSRETVTGTATVRLLCTTLLEVSRQAYYGPRKEPTPAKVVRRPVRPNVLPVAKVLAAMEVIIKESL